MTETESELRAQLTAAFEGAEYPVESRMDLLPTLPDGPGTRFEVGDVSMSAMELGSKLSEYQEFPYEDVETLVEDVMSGLRENGYL